MILKPILKNKKGIQDQIYGIAILFTLAIILVIFFYVNSSLKTQMSPTINNFSTEASTALETGMDNINNSLDWVFVVFFFGSIIILLITSYIATEHPVFLVIYLLFIPVVIVFAVIFSNAYSQFIANSELVSTGASLSKTTFLMGKSPIIALIACVLSGILLYSGWKSREGGGGI